VKKRATVESREVRAALSLRPDASGASGSASLLPASLWCARHIRRLCLSVFPGFRELRCRAGGRPSLLLRGYLLVRPALVRRGVFGVSLAAAGIVARRIRARNATITRYGDPHSGVSPDQWAAVPGAARVSTCLQTRGSCCWRPCWGRCGGGLASPTSRSVACGGGALALR